ncbi:hypothetical protein BDV95DRAFT_319834 [Massariosphaeria phaeospora]|uniref:Uncharacterized protein n=1 Tax=Massariosphaeria phaeospora TaxID=100035 RepID=A0A7C8MDK6_9PLEO|nr:hypothetical protein BDV95DRAFT_319834 [Massariosphaeria phaeospora]
MSSESRTLPIYQTRKASSRLNLRAEIKPCRQPLSPVKLAEASKRRATWTPAICEYLTLIVLSVSNCMLKSTLHPCPSFNPKSSTQDRTARSSLPHPPQRSPFPTTSPLATNAEPSHGPHRLANAIAPELLAPL